MSESVGHRRVTVRVRFPRIAFVMACAVSLAFPVAAQSTNGAINGRVVDPSNGVIVGADILAINDVTGVKYSGKTNNDGIYIVPNLPPGPYRLQVSKVGFKTLIKPDIVLNVQDALSVNFTLPVGAVFETVTVEGGAPLVDTQSAAVSTVVDQNYVANIPLNGRSFQDLILLTPGIVTQSPQNNIAGKLGETGEFTVNGQRAESNYYTVDGVSANLGAAPGVNMIAGGGASGSVASATALGTTQALVSVDDLQEFRVQSSTYSAEYGRNPGGQFAFETKSGTNEWHGTAYDYIRNGAFDADDWFNNYLGVKQPALRQNDFGGTFGGPVDIFGLYSGRDKTFFFLSYEGLRLVQPQAATVNYVPDATLRANTHMPLQQVLNAFPLPNGPDVGNGIAEFNSNWSNPSSINSGSVRVDHVVSGRLRLFFRFSDTSSSTAIRGHGDFATPTEDNSSDYVSRTYTVGATSAFTNRLSNEFRLNYSTNRVISNQVIDSFGGSTPVDLAQLSGLSSNAGIAADLIYDGYELGISQVPQAALQRQWNLVDTVGLSSGKHQFKFGVDYRRLTPIATPLDPSIEYLYLSESSVETNIANFAVPESFAPAYPLYTNFSAFAQDEWRMTPKLNVSLGVRWEINPAPGVTQGIKPYTVAGPGPSTYTLAPQGINLWRTTWKNVAPRLGVNYVLRDKPGFETVIRGGTGIFFDTGQQLGSLGFEGPGYSAESFFTSSPFPLPLAEATPPITNPPTAPYGIVYGYPSNLQLPYTVQWNASIAQALGKSQALTVSYVGAHAARLLEEKQTDGATVGNPNFTTLIFTQNGLTSDYSSLQLQVQRRLNQGLTALVSYTLSHCIDYGSQDYFFAYQRGDCDFDVRNNFSGAFSYDVPNVGWKGPLHIVLSHWGLDDRFTARTAFPVTLQGTAVIDPATGEYYYPGLNSASGQPVYIYGVQCTAVYNNGLPCPGGRAVNPNAFTAPASGLGDAPRNFVRGFGAWQMDLAVRREFPIHERLRLQLRAEAFNLFNHPNFGYINSNFGQSTFGQSTGTLANSLGILSPLYQMGGPRSMQFALKLIF
jgi:hypothetical protein